MPTHCPKLKALGAVVGSPDQNETQTQLTQRKSLLAASGVTLLPSFRWFIASQLDSQDTSDSALATQSESCSQHLSDGLFTSGTCLLVWTVYFLPIRTPYFLEGKEETQQHGCPELQKWLAPSHAALCWPGEVYLEILIYMCF